MKKLVSVIITTYINYEGLFDSLDSVLNQDYPEIEIILSDDGSPGWSEIIPAIEEYFIANSKDNIKDTTLLHLPQNMGTVRNMNYALKRARGEYIKGLGCGDMLLSNDSITKLVNAIEKEKTLVVCGRVNKVSSDGNRVVRVLPPRRSIKKLNELLPSDLHKRFKNECIIPAIGVLVDRRIYDKYGYYDTTYTYLEDHPYWLKITRFGEKLFFLEDVVAFYKMGGISNGGHKELSKKVRKDYMNMINLEIEKYGVAKRFPISTFLRNRRANFIFDYREIRKPSRGFIVFTIKHFDAALYYFLREIKYRIDSI